MAYSPMGHVAITKIFIGYVLGIIVILSWLGYFGVSRFDSVNLAGGVSFYSSSPQFHVLLLFIP